MTAEQEGHPAGGTDALASMPALADKWAELVDSQGRRLRTDTGAVNVELLKQFRREGVFVFDHYPYSDYANGSPTHWWKQWRREPIEGTKSWLLERVLGSNRVERRMLREGVDLLVAEGGRDLLDRYATHRGPGQPRLYAYGGWLVNRRFVRHLYFLNLIRQHVGDELRSTDAVCLDLGSSYGGMSGLVKAEFPRTRHVLVDFPDQLTLAEYFLTQLHPDASVVRVDDDNPIDRSTFEANDFSLVPVNRFAQIVGGSVDLFSNYLSLGEMTREWFEHYVHSDVFRGVSMLVTSNRFVSGPRLDPTYPTGITFLDYPLQGFEQRILDVNPLSTRLADEHLRVFGRERHASSQYFDFIGVRRAPAAEAQ